MNEVLFLFPILFLTYLLQGITGAAPPTTVFRLNYRLRGRLLRRSWLVLSSRLRILLLNPFSPTTTALFSDPFPFSFVASPAGELVGVDFSSTPGSFVTEVTFESTHHFSACEKQLFVDDFLAATVHCESVGLRLAKFLQKLQSLPLPKRRPFLDRELRRRLDSNSIQQRLDLFLRSTSFLATLCHSLFLYVFLLAPLAIFLFGLPRLWPGLLSMLILFSLLILSAFRRARRQLYSKPRRDDFQHLFTIALSPFAAIRALDPLAADLLAGFHPLAIGFTILSGPEFLQYAEAELRRTRFLAHDSILFDSFGRFLSARNIDPNSLLQPPVPENDRSHSFCPVCLAQFVMEQGTCPDCGEVPLESLRNR